MAPLALPGGSNTRDETKKSLVTIRDSLIRLGTDDAGSTDGGNQVYLSQTTCRKRTTAYSGKTVVIQSKERNETTSNGRKGGDEGKRTNLNGLRYTGNNNEAGGMTGCGKLNIFCRGNRTSGKGRNNDGDDSDKEGGKEKDSGSDCGDSTSRPTNKPESTITISRALGPTSLFLVSGPTRAPTLSLPPDHSATAMESPFPKVSPSFTTTYSTRSTSLNLASLTPGVSFLGLCSFFPFH